MVLEEMEGSREVEVDAFTDEGLPYKVVGCIIGGLGSKRRAVNGGIARIGRLDDMLLNQLHRAPPHRHVVPPLCGRSSASPASGRSARRSPLSRCHPDRTLM